MNKQAQKPDFDRLMRLPEVAEACRRSRTSIYNDVKAGRFPEPIRIGPRAIAWRESQIRDWMASRPKVPGLSDLEESDEG